MSTGAGPVRYRPLRPRRWPIRFNLPLCAALILALAMLVGNQFSAPPPAESSVASPHAQAERTAARIGSWMHPLAPGERPPQFVIFSFDGVGSHQHWQRIMATAGASQAHITGFLSGTYLLADADREQYHGPGRSPGKSSIGFGGTPADVSTLIEDLNAALKAGHEIGTHYNGHFCRGSEPSVGAWSTAMWNSELDQFFSFVDAARARGLALDPATIKGGRTPCLEGNWASAVPAMTGHGLRYDTSRTSASPTWPYDEAGIRIFPMPEVWVPRLGKKVILMDYNLWYSLNQATEQPGRAAEFTATTLEAYRGAYDATFTGNRAPLVIGNHFNNWSGGAFNAAVVQFIGEVCPRPETVCATYSEVSKWMDLQKPEVLDALHRSPQAVG